MAKLKWKGGALVAPVPPAMISCMGADGKPNILTVAWTGILCTHPPKTYISVRPSRHSYPLIKESGEILIVGEISGLFYRERKSEKGFFGKLFK